MILTQGLFVKLIKQFACAKVKLCYMTSSGTSQCGLRASHTPLSNLVDWVHNYVPGQEVCLDLNWLETVQLYPESCWRTLGFVFATCMAGSLAVRFPLEAICAFTAHTYSFTYTADCPQAGACTIKSRKTVESTSSNHRMMQLLMKQGHISQPQNTTSEVWSQ